MQVPTCTTTTWIKIGRALLRHCWYVTGNKQMKTFMSSAPENPKELLAFSKRNLRSITGLVTNYCLLKFHFYKSVKTQDNYVDCVKETKKRLNTSNVNVLLWQIADWNTLNTHSLGLVEQRICLLEIQDNSGNKSDKLQ